MSHYDFEQFAAVRNYGDLSFSPDGQWVTYVTNASGQFNVWKQPVSRAAGGRPMMPIQLTALTEDATRRAVWSPDGKRIVTMADRHGTEQHQLYEVPAEQGWLYPLTNNPEARHELAGEPFSPDGRYLVYSSNERSPKDMNLIMRDLETGETRCLIDEDGIYYSGGWSPDGRRLLAARFNMSTDQDLFLVDVETGETRLLTPHEGQIQFRPVTWHPNGHGFYLLSDKEREFQGLAFYNIESEEMTWEKTPEWDVQDADISADGRLLAWLINEDGYSHLYIEDTETGEVRDYSSLPEGVINTLRFSPDCNLVGFYLARSSRPAELMMLDVEEGGFWPLSQSFLGGVPQEEMVEPELIRYPSHDGREIPAFLYKPRQVEPGEQVPVVLSIHGGPEAQELPGYAYNGFYQYLLNQGIGIIATNIRGSSGYGKSYQKLIYRDWGGDELKDLEYAARYVQGLEWVDAERLGVFGGSFGGFATLSCASRLPDYWAAAVDIVGPSNLVTFAKAVPPHWKRFMQELVGDPEADHDFLMERSPITYVDNVQAPLLVIQGANDPRVVKGESDQMVERLQELGRKVEYMVFEDEGHGFTKTSNMLKALKAAAGWFEKYLLKNGEVHV